MQEEKKLDNPVWYSLIETHQDFSLVYDDFRFYKPDFCPFCAACQPLAKMSGSLKEYAHLCPDFYIVGDKPQVPESLHIQNELVCQQMVLDQEIRLNIVDEIIQLEPQHDAVLVALINLVQPGYFRKKTPSMGNYYGVFKHGELVAVTGERMKMNAYTEISAVVTHPMHTGKGYAKQLIAHASQEIFKQHKIPFLHVAESNVGAIKLYEKLGFVHRRNIRFWNIEPVK